MNLNTFDIFFVYKRIHQDDSWGTLLPSTSLDSLPNSEFVIKICANNEREAIAKAKVLYDNLHIDDSEKELIKRFMCSAIPVNDENTFTNSPRAAARAIYLAHNMLKEYSNYFKEHKYNYAVDEILKERTKADVAEIHFDTNGDVICQK